MDRQKALDVALSQIEKQFGKGAVMKMGEEAAVKVAAIPTGALSLDLALGIGGLPRGRVVEIYGPESSGKCLPAGTFVWSDHGLETIEELFARCGQPTSCTSRVTDVREQGIRVVNEEAQLEPMAAVTHNDRRPTVRVTLESGRSVEGTANHPLRVLDERGRIVWRTMGALGEGDVLVSALFGAETAVGGSDLTEDEAVLLGSLVAEGRPGPSSPHGSGSSNASDADDHGLDHVDSAATEVPYRVRTGGSKMQAAFLSALYEEDGWIERGSGIGLTTASRRLAEQVQLLLYGFGIPASLRTRHDAELDRDHHTVLVPPASAHRFLTHIGFRSDRRAAQATAHLEECASNTRVEPLPFVADLLLDLRDAVGGDRELDAIIGDLRREEVTGHPDGSFDRSATRLIEVLEWLEDEHVPASARPLVLQLRELAARPLTFERITAVEDAGEQPTFDIVVPGTHSFVANGVLSHNTTVALHAIAEAQKAGGIAAFIDAEHALDPSYAAALGVDIEELLVSQPDTGEQALEIADMLIRSGAVDILVVDSVAALTPRAEIEGEMGDSHVGLQARLMSQALRKLAGSLNKSRTCAVFINQLREKIGVMFGCFSYNTRVTLADGTQERIGKIVNQQLPVEVLSYDFDSGEFVPRKVVNWFDNGPTDEFLRFTVARGSGNGRSQFSCTPNHLISTPHGWVHAGELSPGDTVLQAVEHHLSDFQWEVILGGLLGDGALSPTRSGHGARFRFGHGAAQAEYASWKASLFANINVSRSTNDRGAVFFDAQPLCELAELRRAVYIGGKKVISHDYIKRLTPLSLAIWYQDDGSFQLRSKGLQKRTRGGSGRSEICVEALDQGSRSRLRDHIADEWGIGAKLVIRGGKAVLQFPTAETLKLHELIAPYVHPSMDYKLLPRFRGRFAVDPVLGNARTVPVPMPIVSIRTAPPNGRHTHRYDIEVEGTHNYFADGVMVHNSPETTPGGRALKFYSSVRLDVRRIESLKDGTNVVGNRVRVKVVKNKCVAAGTRIFDPTTGSTHRIEDVVDGGEGTSVWAAAKDGTLQVRPIGQRLNQGRQQVIGLALRDGTTLRVTPDHRMLTDRGWRQAGDLAVGDRLARPRRAGSFGDGEPVPTHHARMIGYLIGDGSVGGNTPIAFLHIEPELRDDARRIAAELGCRTTEKHDGISLQFSPRNGERNGLLELARWAGIRSHLAPDERIAPAFFAPDVSADVVGNLLFGIFESVGWIRRDRTGAVRVGFTTTSEQLAHQLHWLLLRFGVGSATRVSQPGSGRGLIDGRRGTSERPCWEVRVSGIDNLTRFAEAVPLWGPRGRKLADALADPALARRRGSERNHLPAPQTEPVLGYLASRGVTARDAATMLGEQAGDPRGGMRQVLGPSRLRRDRLAALAEALDSAFLREVLTEDLWYDRITAITDPEWADTYDLEVDELHNFVADDVVVHNCAPPFRQAEFDIMYGEGISREGSLLDVGVDEGVIRKAGAWYTYEGEQLGQGRENARQFLKEHDDVALEIEKKVKEQLGIGAGAPDTSDDDLDEE